jgi:hypothetical protein
VEPPGAALTYAKTSGRLVTKSEQRRGRTASDLMHELAHLIIGHSPGRVDIRAEGALMLNTFERQQEDEANWLAGCRLLPREALLWIRREGFDVPTAARHFTVSIDMLQYRIRVTGVSIGKYEAPLVLEGDNQSGDVDPVPLPFPRKDSCARWILAAFC